MPALEWLRGVRVVAVPAALDGARWTGESTSVLRVAPDEAIALGASGVSVPDEHAIVVEETGLAGAWVAVPDLRRHIEWALPDARPALAQGAVAGVPAKVWLPDEGPALLLTAAAYAAELENRLG